MSPAGPNAHARRIAVAAIILALVIVAVTARRTAIDAFFRHAQPYPAPSAADSIAGGPQSIIAFTIDPENEATGVIDITPPPPPPPPPPAREDTATVRPDEPRPGARPDLDLDELLDRDAGPRSGSSAATIATVPPRPVEITWPETRKLKQCIGQSVSVRIHVSEKGAVKNAKVVAPGVPPECADAALVAARHIRFEPGRAGGVPVEMWTEVRIDFQSRD